MKKIIVVGAGASGILAAGQAALSGADVLLLEKKKQPGRKIRISGKGRCNITNASDIQDFLKHFNKNGRFLHQAFSQFFAPQLMDFFVREGLPLVTERGDRVFPQSGKAVDVVETLINWLNKTGVRLKCSTTVTKLLAKEDRITGVICDGKRLLCDSVILATGGSSYPATGSTGDGYILAEKFGHTIIPLRPSLVPLVTENTALHQLAGLDLRNCGFRLYIDGKRKVADFGEVGFTGFGIGGPVTLTHSRLVVDSLQAGKNVIVSLDLKPALDEQKLDARLLRDFQSRHQEDLQSVLRGLLPQKLITLCLELNALDGGKKSGEVTSKERTRLRTWLKDFRFEIVDHRPMREAIVTAGGISVKEVNPHTMESNKIHGLYITGELLDLDADTGGYNLQAAFSTGWLAGRSAAATLKE
jgi:predicted Rossmann fold flavoprotein